MVAIVDDLDSNIAALNDAIETGENTDLSGLSQKLVEGFLDSLDRCRAMKAEVLRARAQWNAFVMRQ